MNCRPYVEIENVSDTALWVANYRAQESERPDAVFRDPLAATLAGKRGRQIAKTMAQPRLMAWVMTTRTSAIDRLILTSALPRVDTVINLGAGLDTRPYRMKLPSDLRWIEVDFPHLIRYKEEVLRASGRSEKPVCHLQRISLNLADPDQRRELFFKLGSQTQKALIITEGVIPYLSRKEVILLAQDLRRIPTFQFWIQDYFNAPAFKGIPFTWKRKLKRAPWKFRTTDWFGFFSQQGWNPREIVPFIDETRRLGRPLPYLFPWSLITAILPQHVADKYWGRMGCLLLEAGEQKSV